MLRFMRNFLIVIIVLIVVAYFGSGYVFDASARKLLPHVFDRFEERGLKVVDYNFDSIRFTSFRTISVKDASANVILENGSAKNKYSAVMYAEKVNVHIAHLLKPAARLSCENFQFKVEKAQEIPGTTFGRFDHGYIRFKDPIYLSSPREGLAKIMQDISGLFREQDVFPNAEIRALVTFNVKGKESRAFLYTAKEGDASTLRFEEKDIRKMADTFELELSDDEVAIIAQYPLRAPIVMRITSDAKETSENANKRNRTVPEDAYRHLLWSYLLTQKYGEAFAEKVTDAHEVLPTNTAAERSMDYHNNRVGRKYAKQGIKRERILWLAKNDRQVIRRPEDVKTN
jgi:hypothetical protein